MAFSVLAKEEPLPEHFNKKQPLLHAEVDLPDLPQIHHHLEDEKEEENMLVNSEPKEVLEQNSEVQNAILKKEAESKVIENIVDQVYSTPKAEIENTSEAVKIEEAQKPKANITEAKNDQPETIDLTKEQETYSITVEVENNSKTEKKKLSDEIENKSKNIEEEEKLVEASEPEEKLVEEKIEEIVETTEESLENEVEEIIEKETDKEIVSTKIAKDEEENEIEKEPVQILAEEKSQTSIEVQKEDALNAEMSEVKDNAPPAENINKADKKEIEFDNFGTYTKVKLPETDLQNSIIKEKSETNISQTSLLINNKQDFVSIIDNEFGAIEDISDVALENKKINVNTDIEIDRGIFNDPFYEEVTATETEEIADEISENIENVDLGINDLAINENVKDFPPPSKVVESKPKSFHMREKSLKVKVKKVNQQEIKYLQYAHEAMQVGQYESAISYYREILNNNPRNQKISFGLATAYHKAGQYESAKEEYLKIINIDKNNVSALNNYLILVSQENPDIAVERLENLRVKNPEFAAIPAQIGSIYYGKGKLKQASEYYFEAVKLSPKNTNYRYNLAIILEEMNQDKYAAKLYKSLLDDAAKGVKLPESPITIKERFFSLISKR